MTRKKILEKVKEPADNFTSIGNVMETLHPAMQPAPHIPERCRFDMFVRWNKRERRNKHEFCYRGDFYEKHEPQKMLGSLIRMFVNNHGRFFLAELYDNTKPKSDPARIILKYNGGVIMENRLKEYAPMLKEFPLPDWLKTF